MAFNPVTVVPLVNITPNRIVTYSRLEGLQRKVRPKHNLFVSGGFPSPTPGIPASYDWVTDTVVYRTEQEDENLKQDKYKGVMSIAAKKRLTTAINWLYVLSKEQKVLIPDVGKTVRFRLSMLTLTLSAKQVHDDKFIKAEMLNKLLEKLRNNCGMKSYLWRAEVQKNGNIHFHITTNIYVHHKTLRKYWNDIQNRYGYISAFQSAHGHGDPNSTDVHSIYKIKNLAGYLCKYMSKDSEGRLIDGRQWFLSSNLSKIEPLNRIYACDLRAEIDKFCATKKRIDFDYATVFYADIFTSNLKDFPLLNECKNEAIVNYSHLVN